MEVETPYFLIDKEKLDCNLKEFRDALNCWWPNSIIAYSFKTNSLPWLLKYMRAKGCYGEVVSSLEYKLALHMGYRKENIVFNGPIKGKKEFLDAVINNSIVNIDSEQEIEWLEELCSQSARMIKIGIRVNFDLEAACPGEVGYENDGTRFGFCYENGQFESVLNRLSQNGSITITGLHLHTTSKTRSLNIYRNIAKIASKIIREYHLHLEYLDIGGGFFGGVEGKPSFDEYIKIIKEELDTAVKQETTTLVVEPGSALIGSPVSFVTEVTDVKDTEKSRIVTINGSRTNIDPLMIKNSYFYSMSAAGNKIIPKQIISGFTCMDRDRLMVLLNEKELKRGDQIVFDKVGAYTMALNPLFIQYFPAVYVLENGGMKEVRTSWGIKEYLGEV